MSTLKRTSELKRSELVRRTPLKAKTPLAGRAVLVRRTPLSSRSAMAKGAPRKVDRPRPAVSAGTRRLIVARSGGWCELRLRDCAGRATDACHRNGRKAGGRHGAARLVNDSPANVLHGCRSCHDWCHREPVLAGRLGFLVREGVDPAGVPVLVNACRLVLLDDEGRWTEVPS